MSESTSHDYVCVLNAISQTNIMYKDAQMLLTIFEQIGRSIKGSCTELTSAFTQYGLLADATLQTVYALQNCLSGSGQSIACDCPSNIFCNVHNVFGCGLSKPDLPTAPVVNDSNLISVIRQEYCSNHHPFTLEKKFLNCRGCLLIGLIEAPEPVELFLVPDNSKRSISADSNNLTTAIEEYYTSTKGDCKAVVFARVAVIKIETEVNYHAI